MIRTILAALLIIFFFIITIPVLMILWVIGKINMNLHDTISYGIMRGAFVFILFVCGAKVKVEGLENVPKDRPVLYVGNHRSYFDIIVLYRYAKTPTGFIAKKEFKSVPVLGHWISCLHGIFLDRKDIKAGLQTILEAIDNVKNKGISYTIFPEGTRNHNKEMLPFKEGSLKIATKSGCPIVPVAMTHMDDLLENHMPFIKGANVSIRFGEPIFTDQLAKEEQKFLGAKVRDIIQNMMDDME
ncbi:MAG: lysophospholipid acyltransferase family protein [Lachnospiraceae bacterium]|nr:lysophospholipid acyltransferase family protein [Lachnospiraceae bacterium]